jgi:hypothetical protein
MFTLQLCYASTVHSVQSLTYKGPLIFDVNSSSFASRAMYTGNSRSCSFQDIVYLRKFTKKMVTKVPSKDIKNFDAWLEERAQLIRDSHSIPDNVFDFL